jgi:rubrerythrin
MNMAQQVRDVMPTADNSSNFNVVAEAQTTPGSTLDNLKAAVNGETGASAKYAGYAAQAEAAGKKQLAALWRATSAAEQIHIAMEYKLVTAEEPDWPKPEASSSSDTPLDLNLIDSANGEIFETTDMYPSFIKKAQEEGNNAAVLAFTRAKLAEGYHAERYLEAYNNIDNEDGESYYLCPICGYIHKGNAFDKCPICFTPASKFEEYAL